MKIDIHTHILPRELPNWKESFGYGGFITLDHHKPGCAKMMRDDGHFFREIEENCWDGHARIRDCDAHGVDVQVISTVPVLFGYWTEAKHGEDISRFLNEGIAEVVDSNPKRFAGLATVPMQDPELAAKVLEDAKALGLDGVEIGTNINQKNLSEPEYFEFFQACSDLGMAIFVHPWEMMGQKDTGKYWLPWLVGMPAETSRAICSLIFSGVLERLPDLRIAFAHGGGEFPATIGRIEHGFKVRPDLVAVDNDVNPREYLGKIYFDSLVHSEEMLRYLISIAGSDHVALGTDYPFPLGELEPGSLIESMDLDEKTKADLLHGAALKWLGAEKSRFERD
ncbi:MAG: amidohydrolase [Acidobacteria bacterium]|nr:MAG: amidohydrolase [Acidobacteriota bacterium]REK03121.1 MAG: amidohydrolase [Acidobacteriota bacterium]REK15468.1 MAG: amidohydrolase [Acidobacteriota bacterium]REK45819.1 MAG: amidohydrolase [Acidobacteriota bacterium]